MRSIFGGASRNRVAVKIVLSKGVAAALAEKMPVVVADADGIPDDPPAGIVESKGVKAHIAMDESGMLQVTAVEAAFETTITVEQQEASEKGRYVMMCI